MGPECLVDAIVTTVVVAVAVGSVRLDGLALAARGARVAQRHMACVVNAAAGETHGRPRRWLSCEGTWRCQIRPRALRRFAGHAPAGKIDQRCSITVIRWIGILCLADQVR